MIEKAVAHSAKASPISWRTRKQMNTVELTKVHSLFVMEPHTLVSGSTACVTVLALSFGQMVVAMRVNGEMIKQMAKASLCTQMATSTRASG